MEPARATDHSSVRASDEPTIEIPTPDDIVALRRHDPTAGHEWRLSMRDRLVPLLTTHDVVGMNHNGGYILRTKDARC